MNDRLGGTSDSYGGGIDLGHGVYYRRVQRHGDDSGTIVGIIVGHHHEDGAICEGYVAFDRSDSERDRPIWTVETADPLTISPSVQDASCGLHGWIRDGKWVPA